MSDYILTIKRDIKFADKPYLKYTRKLIWNPIRHTRNLKFNPIHEIYSYEQIAIALPTTKVHNDS